MNTNPTLLVTQIQVKFSFIISTTFLKPRNFSFPFLKQKLKVMLTFLEMRKAFKAGGETANKIPLSPPRPATRTNVQAEGVMLLRLPAWEGCVRLNHPDYKKLTQTQEGWLSSRKWNWNNHENKNSLNVPLKIRWRKRLKQKLVKTYSWNPHLDKAKLKQKAQCIQNEHILSK